MCGEIPSDNPSLLCPIRRGSVSPHPVRQSRETQVPHEPEIAKGCVARHQQILFAIGKFVCMEKTYHYGNCDIQL